MPDCWCLVRSSGFDGGAFFRFFPLASSTWKARSKAACRWCFSSYATWRHEGATEHQGHTIRSIRMPVYTSLAETKLSENDDPWWSHHVSPCVILLPFFWAVFTLTSWIGPECSSMASSARSNSAWWTPVCSSATHELCLIHTNFSSKLLEHFFSCVWFEATY